MYLFCWCVDTSNAWSWSRGLEIWRNHKNFGDSWKDVLPLNKKNGNGLKMKDSKFVEGFLTNHLKHGYCFLWSWVYFQDGWCTMVYTILQQWCCRYSRYISFAWIHDRFLQNIPTNPGTYRGPSTTSLWMESFTCLDIYGYLGYVRNLLQTMLFFSFLAASHLGCPRIIPIPIGKSLWQPARVFVGILKVKCCKARWNLSAGT